MRVVVAANFNATAVLFGSVNLHQSKFRSIRIVNPANMAANIAYEFPIMHCPQKRVTSLRPTPGIFSTRNGSKDKQSVVESLCVLQYENSEKSSSLLGAC